MCHLEALHLFLSSVEKFRGTERGESQVVSDRAASTRMNKFTSIIQEGQYRLCKLAFSSTDSNNDAYVGS